jgi:hypothetical protein
VTGDGTRLAASLRTNHGFLCTFPVKKDAMTLARCRRCRQEINSDQLRCPHCEVRHALDRFRNGNAPFHDRAWEPDDRAPFRFLAAAAVVFMLIASLVALLAVLSGGTL